jgi:hypothetical protein
VQAFVAAARRASAAREAAVAARVKGQHGPSRAAPSCASLLECNCPTGFDGWHVF